MKNFHQTLARLNRQRGAKGPTLFGALIHISGQFWVACIPRSDGDWHREFVGKFPTAQEASRAALEALSRKRAESKIAAVVDPPKVAPEILWHLDGTGNPCTCERGRNASLERIA